MQTFSREFWIYFIDKSAKGSAKAAGAFGNCITEFIARRTQIEPDELTDEDAKRCLIELDALAERISEELSQQRILYHLKYFNNLRPTSLPPPASRENYQSLWQKQQRVIPHRLPLDAYTLKLSEPSQLVKIDEENSWVADYNSLEVTAGMLLLDALIKVSR